MNQHTILLNRYKYATEILQTARVEVIFLTAPMYIQYFTDSQNIEGYLAISHSEIILFTDSRYIQESAKLPAFITFEVYENSIFNHLKNKKNFLKGRIGISGDIPFSLYQKLNSMSWKNKFIDVSQHLESLISINDELSISRAKKAISISKKVLLEVQTELHVGISEIEVAANITHKSRMNGANRDAFEPIVAFGKNSAMPHAVPTTKKLQNGDVVLIDLGCVYKNITSDFTRTFVFGLQNPKFVYVFNVISEIVAKVSDALRPGVYVRDLDVMAREILRLHNLEKNFTHALGHGVGFMVHQKPRISRYSDEILQEGHIITLEPGVYFPKLFGVRLENMYLIKEQSSINLTKF